MHSLREFEVHQPVDQTFLGAFGKGAATAEKRLVPAGEYEAVDALAIHEERLIQGLAELLEASLTRLGRRPALTATDLSRLLVSLVEGMAALQISQGIRPGAQDLPKRVTPRILQALTETLD
ncbi:hypothetical protein ACNPQM_34285 [Streptomyces sp. NPDC056231]|uniref:hypothetical protein n=1 Tax=Streptomyces sp. NPDC056231 TaxID=3345755 RepID=UPI003AAE02E1